MGEVFLDTGYVIALASPRDQFHARALGLAERLVESRARLVTTRAVVFEIGNSLSKQRYRAAAIQLLDSLEADPNVQVLPLTDQLHIDALELFRSRPDKEWGLSDCASFVVMRQRGISDALTADEHFEQAGFLALLRGDVY